MKKSMQVWHSTMTLRFTSADAVDELAECTKEASMANLAKKRGHCGVSVKFQAGGCALYPKLEGGNYGQFFPGAFGQHFSSDALWPYWRNFSMAAPGENWWYIH